MVQSVIQLPKDALEGLLLAVLTLALLRLGLFRRGEGLKEPAVWRAGGYGGPPTPLGAGVG